MSEIGILRLLQEDTLWVPALLSCPLTLYKEQERKVEEEGFLPNIQKQT